MIRNIKNNIDAMQAALILIGIGLGVIFWVLESAAHILVFQDDTFLKQIYSPEPHEIWMRFTVVGMFISFGVCSQWIVNARKRAEEAAKLANIELTQIFETAADAMRIVDKDFNVLRVNETFSSLSGINRENAIGKKCYEVFYGPLCKTPACPLTRILNNEDRVECDSDKLRKDGTKIPCIVTATPFRGPDGELIGIVEDFKDISNRKRAEEKLIESRKSLRELASHLQVVRDEERGRIAREIHDEMGQALTVLKMDLHWLGQRLPDATGVLIAKTMAMSKLIETTIQSLKKICSELRPQLLDDFGLSAAIEWQAEEFGSRTGVQFEIISDPEDIILDHAYSTAIFRIFQETLTNIARHANATRAQVILKENPGVIEMVVCDNGKGIKEEQILNPKSFGLIGMRERAHFFGGDFRISGSRDKGTTVKVSIPIDKEGKPHDKNTDR